MYYLASKLQGHKKAVGWRTDLLAFKTLISMFNAKAPRRV